MRLAITGADGFIGRNLALRLREAGFSDIARITRLTSDADRRDMFLHADAVVHLAGVNRPIDDAEYTRGNTDLTAAICDELLALGRPVPVIFASSSQAALDNPYGRSKRAAEDVMQRHAALSGSGVAILRLVNVFGKWCRPNYNSAVATFCHNIARNLPVTISSTDAPLRLVHVDAVVDVIIRLLTTGVQGCAEVPVGPVHETTVGDVVAAIESFARSRRTLDIPPVGSGFLRCLYSTYVSYLPADDFSYALTRHEDSRGVFAEMLRTTDSGQFSFFTAHPGVTRGGHYHHTKTEKFLVVRGTARFGFRHVVTGERRDITVTGTEARVVETVPGWVHDITNIGEDEMFVLLWANESFDPARPDTIAAAVLA